MAQYATLFFVVVFVVMGKRNALKLPTPLLMLLNPVDGLQVSHLLLLRLITHLIILILNLLYFAHDLVAVHVSHLDGRQPLALAPFLVETLEKYSLIDLHNI